MIDRLSVDKDDRELYDALNNEDMLKLTGGRRTRKDQFLLAMAFGFKSNLSEPLKAKDGFFNSRDLHPEDWALLNAVAMYQTGTVAVISNTDEVFEIAQEYAHAGIKLLINTIKTTQSGAFEKQLEKELHQLYNTL